MALAKTVETKIRVTATESGLNRISTMAKQLATNLEKVQKVANANAIAEQKLAQEHEKTATALAKRNIEEAKLEAQLQRNMRAQNQAVRGTSKYAETQKKIGEAISLGKIGAFTTMLQRAGNGIINVTKSAVDYVETLNLFNVAMGETRDEAEDFVNTMSKAFNLDPANLYQSMGVFAQITKSMGATNEATEIVSENLTKLGVDLASAKNWTVEESLQKLRSALVGETEPIRNAGMDVSEASLQQELYAMGVDRTVSSLSYAEKSLVRYNAMIRQSTIVQGDMARTIEQPANLLKQLAEQVAVTARNFGSLFIPVLQRVLPLLIGVTMAIGELLKFIGTLFGIDIEGMADVGQKVATGFGDAGKSIGGATSKIKEFKKYLGGFDELNNITLPSDTGSSGGAGSGGAGGIGDDILNGLLQYDNLMNGISTKAKKIRDDILEFLGFDLETGQWGGFSVLIENIVKAFKELNPLAKALIGIGLAVMFGKTASEVKKLWGFLNNAITAIELFKGGILSTDTIKGITGMSDGFMGVLTSIESCITSLGNFIAFLATPVGLITAIVVAIAGMSAYLFATDEDFRNQLSETFEKIGKWFSGVGKAVKDLYNKIIKPSVDIIVGLVEGALDILLIGLEGITKVFWDLFGWLVDIIDDIIHGDVQKAVDDTKKMVSNVWEHIKDALSKIWDKVVEIGKNILPIIGELIKNIINFVLDFAKWLGTDLVPTLLYWVGVLIGLLFKFIFQTDWLKLGIDVLKAIIDGLFKIGTKLGEWAGELYLKAEKTIKDIDWKKIGKQIVDGLIEGMKNIGSGLSKWASSFTKGVKDALGIHSPARIMLPVGINTTLGITEGMEDAIDSVKRTTKNIAGEISSTFEMTPAIPLSYQSPDLSGIEDMSANYTVTSTLGTKMDDFTRKLDNLISSNQELLNKEDTYNFPVYIGGDKVDDVLIRRQRRNANINGKARLV